MRAKTFLPGFNSLPKSANFWKNILIRLIVSEEGGPNADVIPAMVEAWRANSYIELNNPPNITGIRGRSHSFYRILAAILVALRARVHERQMSLPSWSRSNAMFFKKIHLQTLDIFLLFF